jgi:hypothetical protein
MQPRDRQWGYLSSVDLTKVLGLTVSPTLMARVDELIK